MLRLLHAALQLAAFLLVLVGLGLIIYYHNHFHQVPMRMQDHVFEYLRPYIRLSSIYAGVFLCVLATLRYVDAALQRRESCEVVEGSPSPK